MKYYIVPTIEWGYSNIDSVELNLYSAESKKQLFEFLNRHPINYKITEKDIPAPVKENYKTEKSYNQALKAFKENLSYRLKKENANFKCIVNEFIHSVSELNIPCNETKTKLIQKLNTI